MRLVSVLLFFGLFGALGLVGCETRKPATTEQASSPAALVAVAPLRLMRPDSDCTRATFSFDDGPADTLVRLNGRRYWLSVQVATDSTRPVYAAAGGVVGPAFVALADSAAGRQRVRGFYETYSFILRDSARQRTVFRQQLHKSDFAALGSPEVAAIMNLPRPRYLGFSAAQQTLVFSCAPGIPNSDVGSRATLVLGFPDGRLRRLSPGGSASWDAADCASQLSPSGRYVLTCTELLRPGQPPLQLARPHTNLTAARFLTDTTLLLVYERGDWVQPAHSAGSDSLPANVSAGFSNPEFRTTPAQRRLPTAYVLSTSGRELAHFRLATSSDGMRNDLLRTFVPPARAYLLYDESGKLVLLPNAHPDSLAELPLTTLARYRPPLRPHEHRYLIEGTLSRLTLYVDTLHPRRIRYTLRKDIVGG